MSEIYLISETDKIEYTKIFTDKKKAIEQLVLLDKNIRKEYEEKLKDLKFSCDGKEYDRESFTKEFNKGYMNDSKLKVMLYNHCIECIPTEIVDILSGKSTVVIDDQLWNMYCEDGHNYVVLTIEINNKVETYFIKQKVLNVFRLCEYNDKYETTTFYDAESDRMIVNDC